MISYSLFFQDKGFENTKPVLEAIKNKGITAIGAAGMCWGGEFFFYDNHLCFTVMGAISPKFTYAVEIYAEAL